MERKNQNDRAWDRFKKMFNVDLKGFKTSEELIDFINEKYEAFIRSEEEAEEYRVRKMLEESLNDWFNRTRFGRIKRKGRLLVLEVGMEEWRRRKFSKP